MEPSSLFFIAGIAIAGIFGGLVFYPILQAFGIIACNCDKSPEDKWKTIES